MNKSLRMTPRDRVMNALEGKPAYPVPWIEHSPAVGTVEDAYGVKLEPLTGDPHSVDFHLEFVRRWIQLNELTGCCNIGVPYHYTMAPRITEKRSHAGILTDRASLKLLRFVELTPQHWDNLKRLVDAKQDYAMYASITTGIGHIWQTMDLRAFSVATHEDPDLLHTILERYTEWTLQVIDVCNSIGIDFFWCFDDFAFKTTTIYSPKVLREIVMPYAREVAKAIELPWIWHSDGNWMQVLDDLVSLGMNALNPLEPGCIDVERIMRTYPHVTLVGNVDVNLLATGTPEQVRDFVREGFRKMNRNWRYIAASGNSITDYCKPENVRAMFEQIRECANAQKGCRDQAL